MYKIIDKVVVYLMFIFLILSAYYAFSGTWWAKEINTMQMQFTGENKFYPVLTMGILFIPPMLILLPIKFYIKRKLVIEKSTFNK